MEHLTPLELDAARAGEPLSAAAQAHVTWCAACRAQIGALTQLAAALRTSVQVPAEHERAILVAAQRRAELGRRAARPRRATLALAASLLLALAGLLLLPRQPSSPPAVVASRPTAPVERLYRDADADGRVTVLDAFALARAAVRRTPGVSRADARQVEAVLAMAVSLEASR